MNVVLGSTVLEFEAMAAAEPASSACLKFMKRPSLHMQSNLLFAPGSFVVDPSSTLSHCVPLRAPSSQNSPMVQSYDQIHIYGMKRNISTLHDFHFLRFLVWVKDVGL